MIGGSCEDLVEEMGCGCSSTADSGVNEINVRSSDIKPNKTTFKESEQKSVQNNTQNHAQNDVKENSDSQRTPKDSHDNSLKSQPSDDQHPRPKATYSSEDAESPIIQVAFAGNFICIEWGTGGFKKEGSASNCIVARSSSRGHLTVTSSGLHTPQALEKP